MNIKTCLLSRSGATGATLLTLVILVRAWAATATRGDSEFRARLLEGRNRDGFAVRGRVVKAPQIRSRATAAITIAVDSARFGQDGRWQPVSHELMEMRVYTRGKKGCKGEISRDLPTLTDPEAYGYEIQVQARGRPTAPGRGRPIWMRTYWRNVTLLRAVPGHPVMEAVLGAKSQLLHAYRRSLPNPVYQLAAGAILGDRGPARSGTYGGQSIPGLFTRAGIGHVLAVSGLHVGVLAAGLAVLLRYLRLPKRLRILPMVLTLGAYLLLTGARPATTRATLMAMIAAMASSFRGWSALRSVWAGLLVSAAILLAWRPHLLLDPGFQLSYGAVLSLLLLTRPIGRALEGLHGISLLFCLMSLIATTLVATRYPRSMWSIHGLLAVLIAWRAMLRAADALHRRFPVPTRPSFRQLPGPVRELVAAQFAIQLGMVIPLGSLYFGQFSSAGTVVNLFAIPLIAVFVQAGLLYGVLGVIPWLGPILAWLPKWMTIASGFLFFRAADVGARLLPCVNVPKPSTTLLLAWYAAIAFIFFGRQLHIGRALDRLIPSRRPSADQQTKEER